MEQTPMTDAELAAHLAQSAGRILLGVRERELFSPKALGKAGDQTAKRQGKADRHIA